MGYTVLSGVKMTPYLESQAARLAAALPFDIVVTSGYRSPEAQVQAMYEKVRLGEQLVDTYRDDDMAQAVQDAYPDVAAGVAVLESHPGASKHLQTRALDIRTRDKSPEDIEAMVTAAEGLGWHALVESTPAHLHLSFPAGAEKKSILALIAVGGLAWMFLR